MTIARKYAARSIAPLAPARRFDVACITERHVYTCLAVFGFFHFAIWTALPTAIFTNPFMDVIEGLNYGREWQIGHDKLPPLPWWFLEIAHQTFDHRFAFYALSQIAVLVGLFFVWLLARQITGVAGAWASVLIVDALHYFHFSAVKFNHDLLQIPFWAIAGWAYYNALRHGRRLHWIVLGAAIGCAFWTKYFVLVLIVPMLAFAMLDRQARQTFRTAGPYLAIGTATLIMLPHILWLIEHDFLPLTYASSRSEAYHSAIDRLLYPCRFAGWQFWYLLPAAIVASPMLLADRPARTANSQDGRIILVLTFGPLATLLLMSALSGRGLQIMWGYPLWLYLGLCAVFFLQPRFNPDTLSRMAWLWLAVFCGAASAFIVSYAWLPDHLPTYKPKHQASFPGRALAMEITQRYHAATGDDPRYVIGSMWIGGNVSFFAPGRPQLLIDGRPERTPWLDVDDLDANGALVVWTSSDSDDALRDRVDVLPRSLRWLQSAAQVGEPFVLPYDRGAGSVHIGWAIVKPHRLNAAANKTLPYGPER